MESNSQGYRHICIPSEEDKLNQHLTSTKRLLDFGEQNESFLIWTTEVLGRLLSECYNLHGVLVCTTEQFMVNIFPISVSLSLADFECFGPSFETINVVPVRASLKPFGVVNREAAENKDCL